MTDDLFNDPRIEQYLRRLGDRQKRTETQARCPSLLFPDKLAKCGQSGSATRMPR
jgi:hypothetical protein